MEEELSEKLILRLSSQTSSSVPWLVWSITNKEVIASGELEHQDELMSLADYAKGRQVTVLLDSSDVRLYKHFLPTKPSRQILKALPYMLEDELSEDVEQLHFAIEQNGFDKEKAQYWVNIAIVKKELITRWMSLLSDSDIVVKTMLPDVLCVPFSTDNSISMMELGDGWLFREGDWQGCYIESAWLDFYWQKKNEQITEPLKLQYYSPLPENLTAQIIENSQIELNSVDPELAMVVLAKGAEQTKWNLLQGDLAQKKAVSKNWRIWRPVAALLIIALVSKLIMMASTWSETQSALSKAKADLAASYKKAFPKEKLRINILRTQLKRKVAEATGVSGGTETGFLSIMTKITPVLSEQNKINIESIRFDGNRSELRIAANAPSFQAFEQFKSGLEKIGLDVKQGAVNNEGSLVSGSLSIKELE